MTSGTSPAFVALATAFGATGALGAFLAATGRLRFRTGVGSTARRLDKVSLAIAGISALTMAIATRLLVATIAAALGGYLLPKILGRSETMALADKREGLVEWVFALRDLLRGGSGLAQAIIASGEDAPQAIATEIADLVASSRAGAIEEGLRLLATRLSDQVADRVIGSLLLASKYRGEKLAELLDVLGKSAADEVRMLRAIDTDREEPRGEMRFIVGFTAAFSFLAFTLGRTFMAPYRSMSGEVVLAVIFTTYAAGAALMAHWCRPPVGVRIDLTGGGLTSVSPPRREEPPSSDINDRRGRAQRRPASTRPAEIRTSR